MPSYPIVLLHGMGGFSKLQNLPFTLSYFSGIQEDLQVLGEAQVFVPVTEPYDSSDHRAEVLAPKLRAILAQTGAEKLNLIGHSQGGLDARVLASPAGFNLGEVIASVTTVSAPHHGSPVADLIMGTIRDLPQLIVKPVIDTFIQLLEHGVYPLHASPNVVAQLTEMTTRHMKEVFNPRYQDATGVAYASYAGRTNRATGTGDTEDAVYPNDPRAVDHPQALFRATAEYMTLLGLQTDGLVPIVNAKWGTFLECVPGDHMKQVGMFFRNGPDSLSGFDHLVFFRKIISRLRAQGL